MSSFLLLHLPLEIQSVHKIIYTLRYGVGRNGESVQLLWSPVNIVVSSYPLFSFVFFFQQKYSHYTECRAVITHTGSVVFLLLLPTEIQSRCRAIITPTGSVIFLCSFLLLFLPLEICWNATARTTKRNTERERERRIQISETSVKGLTDTVTRLPPETEAPTRTK